jgi:hypothetical protein
MGLKTKLIIANVSEWQSVLGLAGCDYVTAPPHLVRDLLSPELRSDYDVNAEMAAFHEEMFSCSEAVKRVLGDTEISELFSISPEFVDFLMTLRRSRSYKSLRDGDLLAKTFDEAGFGSFFYSPNGAAWKSLTDRKLPDLTGPLIREVALDTHFSLLADADFQRYHSRFDAFIEPRMERADQTGAYCV